MLRDWTAAYNDSFAHHYRYVPANVEYARATRRGPRLPPRRAARSPTGTASALGFCRNELHDARGEIGTLGVVQAARGIGLGRALLRWGVRWLEAQQPRTRDAARGRRERGRAGALPLRGLRDLAHAPHLGPRPRGGLVTTAERGVPEPPRTMRPFLTLWTTQTLSLFGTFVSQFAINIWLTQELYPSPAQKAALALGLSATTLAFTAPMIVLAPIAGAFADRHDRRRILVVANTSAFAITAALTALLAAHSLTLGIASLLLAGYSACASFHNAAFDSSIPRLAPTGQLSRANGMMMSSYALSQLLAPAMAATLIGLPALARGHAWHAPWLVGFERGTVFAFAADAVTFALAVVGVIVVRIPHVPPPASAARASLVADVREGFAWIATRRPFLWLIAFGSLANFALAPLSLLLPVLVRDRMHADWSSHHVDYPAALATVNVVGGLGAVIGGVLVSVWGSRVTRRPLVMIACIAVLGIGAALTGVCTTVFAAAASLFVTELVVAPLNTISATMWQSLTPPHMLARALSTRRFIAQIFYPIGTMVAGGLAAAVEPWLVVGLAGALLALVCGVQLLDPRLGTLEDRMREAASGTRTLSA